MIKIGRNLIKKVLFILILLFIFIIPAQAEKILFHRDTGIMYGRWSDEAWKSAPVSKEADGTYRIRKPFDWSVNVHLPLELYTIDELGADDPANQNELINALKSFRRRVDIDGNPRHTIKGTKGAEYIDDAKQTGWIEYIDESLYNIKVSP